MSARTFTPSTAHATSGWREQCHHGRGRETGGRLDALTPEVIARFLDEGVPEGDALYVASETLRCVRDLEAGDELPDQLHPWTWEILVRYGFGDKAASLFLTARGRVERV